MRVRANDVADARWRIEIDDGCRVIDLRSGATLELRMHAAAMVAVLSIDGPTERSRLCGLLWPSASMPAARNSLKVLVHRLKKNVAGVLVSGREVLALSGASIVINPRGIERAVERSMTELLAATALMDSDEFRHWLGAARVAARRRMHDELPGMAARLEADGELAQALRVVDALLRENPLDEFAARRRMNLHFLRGDRASAIAEFERFEQLLKDELGARPSEETRALLTRIEALSMQQPATSSARLAAIRRQPPFVGREAELGRLHQAWDSEQHVLVLGEAALGKSWLLRAFASGRRNVVVAQARPGDSAVPYGLLSRLVRETIARHPDAMPEVRRDSLARVLPDLPPHTATGTEAVPVVSLVGALLADALGEGLEGVVIDDLHFADAPSLDVISALFESDRLRVLRWAFASRPTVAGGPVKALALIDEAQHVHCEALGPMDLSTVERLLSAWTLDAESAPRQAARLLPHTGGSPGFLVDTVRQMALDGDLQLIGPLPRPRSATKLIEQRLAGLTPKAVLLARIAAISGVDFSIELAEALSGATALQLVDAWRELEDAQVLRGDRFSHDLAHEVTLATLPIPVAKRTHGQVAQWLAQRGGPPARVAEHWKAAGDDLQAGEAFLQAAARARRDARRGGEEDLLQRAADSFDRGNAPRRAFEALEARFQCLVTLDLYAPARTCLSELLVRADGDGERLQALSARALLQSAEYADEQALAWVDEALELSRQLCDERNALRLLRLRAYCLGWLGRADEALVVTRELRAWCQAHPDDPLASELGLQHCVTLQMCGRDAEALAELEPVEARLAGEPHHPLLLELLQLKAELQLSVGRLTAAVETLRRDVEVYRTRHGGDALSPSVLTLGDRLRQLGRFSESLTLLESALPALERAGNDWSAAEARCALAQLYAELGQSARAQRLLPDVADAMLPGLQLRVLTARGIVLQAQGRCDSALWERVEAVLPRVERPTQAGWVVLARSAADFPAERVLERLQAAVGDSLALGQWRFALPLQVALLETLLRSDHLAEASELAELLAAQLDVREPLGFSPSRYWAAIATARARAGDAVAAGQAHARAQRWIDDVALPNVPAVFRESFLRRSPVTQILADAVRPLIKGGAVTGH